MSSAIATREEGQGPLSQERAAEALGDRGRGDVAEPEQATAGGRPR
ncbi:hypothetical protein R2B67_33770 [Streptomyces cyaneofuscatus]|nr:hypothetical protein [Streptomyces cyaneofuscatus]WOP13216.1 hypothetical protein R2B67_33770 [Streptomyces cyaneofuscatus]